MLLPHYSITFLFNCMMLSTIECDDSFKRCFCLTSVTNIGRNSRTERPRMHKIGTEVAHITCDQDTNFQVKRSKARLQLVVMCMTVSYVLLIQNHGCLNSTNIISLNRSSLTGTGQTLQAASTESEQERQQTKQLRRSACKSSGNQYT